LLSLLCSAQAAAGFARFVQTPGGQQCIIGPLAIAVAQVGGLHRRHIIVDGGQVNGSQQVEAGLKPRANFRCRRRRQQFGGLGQEGGHVGPPSQAIQQLQLIQQQVEFLLRPNLIGR
jgi:hypothetical protein